MIPGTTKSDGSTASVDPNLHILALGFSKALCDMGMRPIFLEKEPLKVVPRYHIKLDRCGLDVQLQLLCFGTSGASVDAVFTFFLFRSYWLQQSTLWYGNRTNFPGHSGVHGE